ncbi:helix-turn-helix transcriptional regulator [Henriciella sp. AS95]|uniref:helix-turn-helix domain-containing protein n=1 Tax=Henriciella sp. AS95 TaxID=3135782 RepID=UPI0031714ABB
MNLDPDTQRWTEHIGQKIRELRKAEGLTLDGLSRISGATVPTLSHIERGTRDVKLSTLIGLARALRVRLPDLLVPSGQTAAERSTPSIDGYDLDDD